MLERVTKIALYLYIIVTIGTGIAIEGPAGSLSRLLGIPLVVLWLLTLNGRKGLRKPSRFSIAIFAFFVWNAVTLFWSVDTDSTAYELYRYVLTFGCITVIWDMIRTREDADAALQALVVGGYVVALQMMFNYLTGHQLDTYKGRFTAGGFNPNEPGKIFAITIPVAWYLGILKEKQSPLFRLINGVYPLFGLVGVMISASRGGLVACAPAVLFILFNMRKMPIFGKIVMALVVIGALVLLSHVDLSFQLDRLSTMADSSSAEDKLNGRTVLWQAGWDCFAHNPFIGVGTGAFPAAVSDNVVGFEGLPAHNTFLSIATETGVIGLLIFLTILTIVIKSVMRSDKPMRWMWISCLVCLLLSISSSAWEIRPHPWLMLALIFTWNQASQSMRDSRRVNNRRLVVTGRPDSDVAPNPA